MKDENAPPTEAELREAELLARALDHAGGPGSDVTPIDDALGAAFLLRAGVRPGLDDLRDRAIRDGVWPDRARHARVRLGIAVAAAIAAAAVLLAVRPRGGSVLPPPPADLLRAQLAAARPGAHVEPADVDRQMGAYREQLYAALRRSYGATP